MFIRKEKRKLGELLKDIGLLDADQIDRALLLQKEQGIKFGDAVTKLGFLTKDDISWALSTQLNIPYIPDLEEKAVFDPASTALLPYDFAKRHSVIILGQTSDAINIVTSDPLNQTVLEYIERINDKHINISIGDEQSIQNIIEQLYRNNTGIAAADDRKKSTVVQLKFEVSSILNEVGFGFDAEVYKNAICASFGGRAQKNVEIPLLFKSTEIGKYFIDIVIDNAVGVLFTLKNSNEQHIHSLIKLGRLHGVIVIKVAEELTIEASE